MRLEIEILDKMDKNEACVGNVDYGTVVKHQGHFYIKLNKRKTGNGICLKWTEGNSILFNPIHGTIREVPGNTLIKVYEGKLQVVEAETARDYYK